MTKISNLEIDGLLVASIYGDGLVGSLPFFPFSQWQDYFTTTIGDLESLVFFSTTVGDLGVIGYLPLHLREYIHCFTRLTNSCV